MNSIEQTRAALASEPKTFATNFLTAEMARELMAVYGAPLYAYSEAIIRAQAAKALSIPAPYGLTVRYAMKANPNPEVLGILASMGVVIDASSEYEALYAIEQGFSPRDILLTSQELAQNLVELVGGGVNFTACSLHQMEVFGRALPGANISVRINPGVGTGHSQKTNTGGVTSSFGIWHEYIPKVLSLAEQYGLNITRVHTHVGSGTDAVAWARSIDLSLEAVEKFPTATILDIGGGFKVGRMDNEKSTDMDVVGDLLQQKLRNFAKRTGRELHLEIEPGTFLVANAGILVAQVDDIVDTGAHGYTFIKLNTGMSELIRPSMYAAQHPIAILNDVDETGEYVVVGHCCESGDLLTPSPTDPEKLQPRRLNKPSFGDVVLIGGCGAYAASMAAHGYNGFPRAAEVVV